MHGNSFYAAEYAAIAKAGIVVSEATIVVAIENGKAF